MKLFDWLFSKGNDDGPSFEVANYKPEELASELTNVRKEIDQLKATHAGELASKDEKLAAAETQAEELTAQVTDFTAQVESLKAEAETAAAAHAEALEASENSADEKAQAILAQAGHEPLSVQPDAAETRETIISTYKAMSAGPERIAYRDEHKEVLKAAGAIR